ncbi:protein KRI1 homolog [Macrosteles quadrilineatus]|uniref:protein KRI1 homolog n=1 Tax=Macrosteles quadrilineatus TaxID=74068 RepID=UPI0023E169E4|nr:protein KRI1 homolog [Macrosteles quadrilineatus]
MKSYVKDELLQSSSSDESGSEDDEEAWKLTDKVEKEFFKTLSHIKSKDPKIYQKGVEFFKDVPIPEQKPEKSKIAPLTLRDYERKIVVEKGGELSDEESLPKSFAEVSYVEEQRALKNSLKNLLQSDSEYESEAEWGGLFKKRDKSKTETEKEEKDYKEWLKGQKSEAPDEEVAKEMKPLRDFWTNPDLKEDDQFLRDYILNKRFLEADDKEATVQDKSESEDDQLDKDCSHRSEEPDHEYIKRYPRVMENSVRQKDDYRKRKREEIKERKQKEKQKKKAEIKQKQKLKKKEIEEKLEELKKLTGNEKLAFDNVLDKDFDIDEHDKAMQKLFDEEFYSQDDPSFNPVDDEDLDGEWQDEVEVKEEDVEEDINENEPQCEDPNFNMDCDYDPAAESTKPKKSRSKRRKDKHRKNTVGEVLKREKPVFDPTVHKSFEDYVDQYYAIDCEDFIGDLPCRFKYRQTVPNSYGLTVEEILAADPKELERWCSIKRITQLKPSFKEKSDAMSFKKKAENEALKRKILPSLYKISEDEKSPSLEDSRVEGKDAHQKDSEHKINSKKTKKKASSNKNDLSKKRKSVASEMIQPPNKRRKPTPDQGKPFNAQKNKIKGMPSKNNNNKKEIRTQNTSIEKSGLLGLSDARLEAYGIKPKKFRNKLIYNNKDGNKNKPRKQNISSKDKQNNKSKAVNTNSGNKGEESEKRNKKKNKQTNEKKNGWTVSSTS